MLAPAVQNRSSGVEPIFWCRARVCVGSAKGRPELSVQVSEQETLICVLLEGLGREKRGQCGISILRHEETNRR